jgi:predicted phage terminase large subunit-like protein
MRSLPTHLLTREQKIAIAYAKAEKLKRQARRSFKDFVLYTKPDFQLNWHHDIFFDYLQRFIDGEIQNLCIEAPPRHTKSESTSRRLPAFLLGLNPLFNIILGSYSDSLASAMNRDVQRIIDTVPYRELFPQTTLSSSNVRSDARGSWLRNADQFEIVGHGGGMKTVGRGAGVTGFGADFILVDDPLKNREEAKSKTIRDKTWDWFTNDLMTRLQGRKQTLVTMTRWHEDDLIGRIRANQKIEEFPQFEFLTLQAIKTDSVTIAGDPRKNGDALWPDRYPLKFLQQRRAALLNDFESLFQQEPTPAEGGKVKKSQIKYYTEPLNLQKVDRMILSCDLTFDDAEGSDYTVLSVYAKTGPNIFLIHQVRELMDINAQLRQIPLIMGQFPKIIGCYIEKAANGAATIKLLQNKIAGIVPVIPTKSKVDRLDAVLPLYEAGNIWYPHPSIAPWILEHEKEMLTFPNAKHDDRVDAESQALSVLGNDSIEKMKALASM